MSLTILMRKNGDTEKILKYLEKRDIGSNKERRQCGKELQMN